MSVNLYLKIIGHIEPLFFVYVQIARLNNTFLQVKNLFVEIVDSLIEVSQWNNNISLTISHILVSVICICNFI